MILGKTIMWPTLSFECSTLSPNPIPPADIEAWVLARRECKDSRDFNGDNQSSRYCSISRDLTARAQIATL